MIKYKSYGKIPKKLYGVKDSFCNKPRGGLWGCRGEEWKEWCIAEDFNTDKLKDFFFFKLKPHSKIYRIKTVKDFENLLEMYPLTNGNTTIDFMAVSKDYDAVEVVGDIVYKLRFGLDYKENDPLKHVKLMGLYSWDVPSICVLNPKVVELLKEI